MRNAEGGGRGGGAAQLKHAAIKSALHPTNILFETQQHSKHGGSKVRVFGGCAHRSPAGPRVITFCIEECTSGFQG